MMNWKKSSWIGPAICLALWSGTGVGWADAPAPGAPAEAQTLSQVIQAHGTAVFLLSTALKFNWATGMTTSNTNGGAPAALPEAQAEAIARQGAQNIYIRVREGKPTVEGPGGTTTSHANPLDGGQAVTISMQRISTTGLITDSVNGKIVGDLFTGSCSRSISGPDGGVVANGLAGCTTHITVVPKDQWPPLPPDKLSSKDGGNQAVNLSWTDPNEPGLVWEYIIYRAAGLGSSRYAEIGRTNQLSYTDTPDQALTQKLFAYYYVVAQSREGKLSNKSNSVTVNLLTRQYDIGDD